MTALLERNLPKRSGREVLSVIKGWKNDELGNKLPSSANKRSNRAPRSRCLATSSLMIRGWCPVIAILEITCPTMYIMISWRCRYKDTSTGSLSSKMKDLYQRWCEDCMIGTWKSAETLGGGVLCMWKLKRSMTSLELNCCLFHLRSSISFSINWPSIKQRSPATVCK